MMEGVSLDKQLALAKIQVNMPDVFSRTSGNKPEELQTCAPNHLPGFPLLFLSLHKKTFCGLFTHWRWQIHLKIFRERSSYHVRTGHFVFHV